MAGAMGGTVDGWRKIEVLGEGGFGKVWLVKKNGQKRAMKEVLVDDEDEVDALMQEVEILSSLKHRNIVKCYGCVETDDAVYMFLELMKMSLKDFIDDSEYMMSEGDASHYTKLILRGLVYLHGNRIVHRDIKCANILLDHSERVVKLADMGISKFHNQATLESYNYLVGTWPWMSPEVVSGHEGGKRSDVWSLGCTVYEMIETKPPFYELAGRGDLRQLKEKIVNREHEDLVERNENFSNSLKDFLLDIFVKMSDRPTAGVVANHEWLD